MTSPTLPPRKKRLALLLVSVAVVVAAVGIIVSVTGGDDGEGAVVSSTGGTGPAAGHPAPNDPGTTVSGSVSVPGTGAQVAGTGGQGAATDGTIDLGTPGVWQDITPPGTRTALGVAVGVDDPDVVYVNGHPDELPSSKSGIFKSMDHGDTWTGPIGTKFYEQDGTPYSGPFPWESAYSWTLTIDPTDANTLYALVAFAGPQGPWKTTDGGNTWRSILSPADADLMTADIYAIAMDPLDHLHLLMTFHSPWGGNVPPGVAESMDGGATWIRHPAASDWGTGHYAFFLGQDDNGQPSSAAWILATQTAGFWRTMDSGQHWTQVDSTYNMQHGAGGLYRASTGVLYMGAANHLIRSTDNGRTWADAGAPSNEDGYNAVIGDGVRMYVQSTNTGVSVAGPQSYSSSLETDGTHWTADTSQTFDAGPGWMAADRVNKIIYSANWDSGLWRLVTGN